ncbi:MAG: ATP-binding protein [Oscillospiraceae bacterium]|nr:ATP-binding protein [Oscillospiraceae bacterium]
MNLDRKAPKRIAAAVLNSLKGGVVPRVGLEYITVGRSAEINALLRDVELIAEGGAAFRFLVGRYGSGKSFLLQTIRGHVLEKGFVALDADLSPERRFSGTRGQGLATYRELMRSMSTRGKPDGGALPLVLEKWISGIQTQVTLETGLAPGDSGFDPAVTGRIFQVVQTMENMVNGFDFGLVLSKYWRAHRDGDEQGKSQALRWFRGEFSTRTEARQALGTRLIVTDDNWYDFLKLLSAFLVQAGYRGMLVFIDELVNLYRIPHRVTRQYNYEKLLTMYNDILQGKARHMGMFIGATPQCMEDADKGVFSYDALRSRLTEGRFAQLGGHRRDLLSPILRLEPLTHGELLVLTEKLAALHATLYDYECALTPEEALAFLRVELERIGAAVHITPREVIRDFIELLNLASQSGKGISALLEEGGFALSAGDQEDPEDEFAGFEI